MRHGYTILNQSVNFLTVYGLAVRPNIAKRQCTIKKVLYVSLTIKVQLCNYLFQRAEPLKEHCIGLGLKCCFEKKNGGILQEIALKQDSSTFAFCMIMLPPIRHAF